MREDERLRATLDKAEIVEVATLACRCRDSGKWEALAECFHPDAAVSVSWHSGPAEQFIERSRRMTASQDPRDFSKHMMANPCVRLNRDRAILEYDVVLHQRRTIDGYEMDFQTWSRYVDLMEKREGRWRIFRRTAVYEKDRMDPCRPREVPDSFYESMMLEGYPPAIRFHCWRNEKSGHAPSRSIVLAKSPEEKALREAGESWLSGE